MTGVRYWRQKRRLSKKVLSEKTGVSPAFIANAEEEISPMSLFSHYILLAKALDVTIDQLFEKYDDADLSYGDHGTYRAKKRAHSVANCIAEYRIVENFTYQELSSILGITSREGARKICNASSPPSKHIKAIAERENLPVDVFIHRYSPERATNV